jgi:Domain of unknown function (DUF4304)
MANKELESRFNAMITTVARELAPFGFKKHGRLIRLFADGNCALISFQRSSSSSAHLIRFTINIGLVLADLLAYMYPNRSLRQAQIMDSLLLMRFDKLVSDRELGDKWWDLTDSSDSERMAAEVADFMVAYVAPFVTSHLTTAAILRLWKADDSVSIRGGFINELIARLETEHSSSKEAN